MKSKAARSHDKITNISNQKDRIMPVTKTVCNTFEGEEHEEQVRQGIDNLGRVNGCIIVLESIRVSPSR